MKITRDNLKPFMKTQYQENLMMALLDDLDEMNKILEEKNETYKQLFIDVNTEHTQYSEERTEPCPDYYGMFSIHLLHNQYETIGDYMNIEELDNAMFILYNFIEIADNNKDK